MNPRKSKQRREKKMVNRKRLAISAIVVAIFLVAIPSTTPRVYGAAAPCLQKCSITILAPGGALNSNTNVNSSFLVSFAVHNFTLQNPGTTGDVNTTTSGGGAHNDLDKSERHTADTFGWQSYNPVGSSERFPSNIQPWNKRDNNCKCVGVAASSDR
jgi:hypothetical protein